MANLVNLLRRAEYGLSMKYMDQLMTGQIALGTDKIERWLNPRGIAYGCFITCNYETAWQEKPAIPVKMGTFAIGNWIGTWADVKRGRGAKKVPITGKYKYWNGSTNSSYVELPGREDLVARDWGADKQNPSKLFGLWSSLLASNTSPMIAKYPKKSPSHSYNLSANGFKNTYPIKLNFGKVENNGITIKADAPSVKFSSSEVVYAAPKMNRSAAAQLEFSFIPRSNAEIQLTYEAENSVSGRISNGVSNANTLSGETSNSVEKTEVDTNSTSVGAKVEAKLKVTEAFGVGGEASTGRTDTHTKSEAITEAYKSAWAKQKSVSFSSDEENSSSVKTTASVNASLKDIIEVKNGVWGVKPDSKLPIPVTASDSVRFVEGQRYKAVITQSEALINSVVTGDFKIGGSAGTLKDNYSNEITMHAAEAINNANHFLADDVFDTGNGTVDPDNTYQGGRFINFRGSAEFDSLVTTAFAIQYYHLTAPSSARLANNKESSLALTGDNKESHNFDLSLIQDGFEASGVGHWLALKTRKNETSTIKGDRGGNSVVEASTTGNHKFVNHKSSFLFGNDEDDTFHLTNRYAFSNQIEAKGGDDFIETRHPQNAFLGTGDDTYKINSGYGNHQVILGKGHDHVIINNIKNDLNFVIADFNYIDDRISLGRHLDYDKLGTKLVTQSDKSSLDGAFIKFKYDDKVIGRAYVDHDKSSEIALENVEDYIELGFLNSSVFNWGPVLKANGSGSELDPARTYKKLVLDGKLFTEETYSANDWKNWSNDRRSEIIVDALSATGVTVPINKVTQAMDRLPNSLVEIYSVDMIFEDIVSKIRVDDAWWL